MKKKTVVLGVAGALAVAGGGAGFAATQNDSNDSQAVINDAAKQLGVTPNALSNALKTALKNRVDAAVAAGRLTKEQGDALKARIDAGDLPLGVGGFHHGGPGHFLELDAAADYLGLTEAQLRSELAGGKTLAQVARDHGKGVGGLINAMVAEAKSHLDDAVAEGRITQSQADSILADLKQRITDRVNNGTFRGFGGLDRERFHGPGATF
jgi:polyhydroxyalkanoate synthesis regulator phasin